MKARCEPPLRALTCEPSIAQSFISSRLACRSSTSRASCRQGHTPTGVQSRSRRQQVTPEQIRSAGTSAQDTPLRRTYTIPVSAVRSSTGLRPGKRCRRGGRAGISGAIRSQRSLGTRSLSTRRSPRENTAPRPSSASPDAEPTSSSPCSTTAPSTNYQPRLPLDQSHRGPPASVTSSGIMQLKGGTANAKAAS